MVAGERFEEVVDPVDGTRWRVDVGFLGSRWRCRWGDGCQGILDEPAEHLQQGCCSVGAELLDEDEAMLIGALAATLPPERFQHHADAAEGGVYADRSKRHTRVVDGACIFFNHPGFAGGTGCALHLAALDDGERPMDGKPSVCWQLPLKVERADGAATLRRWRRDDWGPGGRTMAWCCTEASEAEDGDVPVAESLADELRALVGPEVAVEIRRRISGR
ncbi:MAG: hypothetical protein ACLGIC_00825 [Acidimicrobiia bacterium]